jgi:hypothetical protein
MGLGLGLLDYDIAVEGQLCAVEDVSAAKVEAVEEVLFVVRRLGLGLGRLLEWTVQRGRCWALDTGRPGRRGRLHSRRR